jgi:hypothetical protein
MPTTRVEGLELPSQEFMSAGIVLGSKTQPPPGVAQKAQLNSIEPSTCFKNDLLPGESIVKTYDVHMPGQLMPRWFFWLLTCITFGIFYLYWTCYRWCLQMGYCTIPRITMNRGKMVITSTGRVLVWKTNFKQARMGSSSCCSCCCCRECADPIDWQSHTFSRTYNISNINDVELRLCQQKGILCGICCCTEQYNSSVRVRFGDFRQEQLSLTAHFQTMPVKMYTSIVANMFSHAAFNLFALARSLLQELTLRAEDINWVDIVSERIDEKNKDVENPDF